MESLSLFLRNYKDLIGGAASIVTIAQFFSGAFICRDIYKQGSTKNISPNPFIGGNVIGILMWKYASILNDNAMLSVNIAAIVLNVIYSVFYYYYEDNKSQFHKILGKSAVFTMFLLSYAYLESPDKIEYRFGLIVTILMMLFIGSPLMEVSQVIEKQDSSPLPFPIILSGTVVSFLWLLYGIVLMNEFMIFQNCVGLALCTIQLALCIIYPAKSKTE